MAKSQLTVVHRQASGKGVARTLRREQTIPGVVYGKGMDACPVTVDPKALRKALDTGAGWNTLLTLKGDGPFDGKVVVVKDMDVDPIRRDPLHVDFHAIDLKTRVHVMVPFHTIGQCEGEKVGGSLQTIRKEIEVYCLPTEIPEVIEVDVTAMQIGDVLHVADLPVPKGVEIPYEVNYTVVTVIGHKEEAEEEVEGAEAAAETAEA